MIAKNEKKKIVVIFLFYRNLVIKTTSPWGKLLSANCVVWIMESEKKAWDCFAGRRMDSPRRRQESKRKPLFPEEREIA